MAERLRGRGFEVGHHRARSLMRLLGLRAAPVPRYRVTADSRHSMRIMPNTPGGSFAVSEPSRVWAGDITRPRTREGWYAQAAKNCYANHPPADAGRMALPDCSDRLVFSPSRGLGGRSSNEGRSGQGRPRHGDREKAAGTGLIRRRDRGGQYAGGSWPATAWSAA